LAEAIHAMPVPVSIPKETGASQHSSRDRKKVIGYKMSYLRVDHIDTGIIELLKKNGRMPNTEIAHLLNLSETAIRKRLKRLLDEDIVQVVAIVDQRKLGYELEGNIKIKTDSKKNQQVKESLRKLNRVWYIAHVTGASDFDVEFNAKSQDELHDLIETINQIDGICSTEISIRLQLVKNLFDWRK
jgi:Lrp/AsnC family transcriptional regulator for asnA, asnC and gidA